MQYMTLCGACIQLAGMMQGALRGYHVNTVLASNLHRGYDN